MAKIYTYGFAGHSIEEFLEQMQANQIEVVIDVRERPLYKKDPNFDKFPLVHRLQRANTQYLHIKTLGCTKDMRQLQEEELGYLKYFREYERHLQKHRQLIRNLADQIKNTNICLLCAEPDPQTCHRTLVADYLQIENYDTPIEHLQ